MTTIDDRPKVRPDGTPVLTYATAQPPLPPQPAEAALLEEIQRLQQRVEDLEFTVTEYRGQMSQIFGSASWKLTSPVRITAARYRTAKIRARRAAKSGSRAAAAAGGPPPARLRGSVWLDRIFSSG